MKFGMLAVLGAALFFGGCATDPFAGPDGPDVRALVRQHRRKGTWMAMNGPYGEIYRAAARYFDTSAYYTVTRDYRAIYADDFHGMYSVGVFFRPTDWPDQTIVEVLYEQENEQFMESGQQKVLEQSMLDGIVASLRKLRTRGTGMDLATAGAEGRLDAGRARQKVLSYSEVDAAAGLAKRARPQDAALIIGVERYAQLGDADYASRDAGVFHKYAETVLGIAPNRILDLDDRDATRESIAAALRTGLPALSGKDSRVWIYFAGHGGADASTGKPYLLPWDADPDRLERTSLSLEDVYKDLLALPAKEVVAMMDTSFSGFGGRTWNEVNQRPLIEAQFPALAPTPRISMIIASGPGEIARASEDQGHGLFTYYLLRGLRGEAADGGHLTLTELYRFVEHGCSAAAYRYGRTQTPRMTTMTPELKLW